MLCKTPTYQGLDRRATPLDQATDEISGLDQRSVESLTFLTMNLDSFET